MSGPHCDVPCFCAVGSGLRVVGFGFAVCERGVCSGCSSSPLLSLLSCLSQVAPHLRRRRLTASCFRRCCHGLMLLCCRFWGFGLWGWVWLFVRVVRALVALVLRFCHFCPVCLRWLLNFAVATFLLPEMLPRPHALVL